jgi:hypothetical protein
VASPPARFRSDSAAGVACAKFCQPAGKVRLPRRRKLFNGTIVSGRVMLSIIAFYETNLAQYGSSGLRFMSRHW